MRVLVTSPVFPPDLGGPAVYVPSVARFLQERGHEVKVVAFCSDPEPKGHPFPVIAISRGNLLVRYLKAFCIIWREARGQDVVYINEHLALLHVLAVRLAGAPAVIRIMVDGSWEIAHRKGWCHGDDIVTYQSKSYGWKVGLVRFLQRRWWGGCKHIICCSEFLRQILIQSHGVAADKVQRIFNAYHGPEPSSVTASRSEAREQLGLDPKPRYLLTICRLMNWKRVDGIMRAMVGLPEEVQLLVAGDGDMLEEWTALGRELGIESRVHFLGNVPHSEIPLYIRAAEVFVLNSEYEGLSHTLLEVQALGTPIVASGVCGNPEVVADGVNGLLADPRDPESLRGALKRLFEEPEMAQSFAEEGLARAVKFTREGTFSQVEAALAKAAGVDL